MFVKYSSGQKQPNLLVWLSNAFLLLQLQLVFADRNEVISGGNFHGEYPAKVG